MTEGCGGIKWLVGRREHIGGGEGVHGRVGGERGLGRRGGEPQQGAPVIEPCGGGQFTLGNMNQIIPPPPLLGIKSEPFDEARPLFTSPRSVPLASHSEGPLPSQTGPLLLTFGFWVTPCRGSWLVLTIRHSLSSLLPSYSFNF